MDVAWTELEEHQNPSTLAPVRQWLLDRGWPDDVVTRALRHPDVHGVPPTSKLAGVDAKAVVKGCHQPREDRGRRRAILYLRSAIGNIVSCKGRATWTDEVEVKSSTLRADVAGAPPGVRCFGSLPIAALSERIVIVEGGPDWLAVYGSTDDRTAVIGASSMRQFEPTAEALADLIRQTGHHPEVILWPDAPKRDEKTGKLKVPIARNNARPAIGALQRAGAKVRWIERDEVPDVETWEASDVLKARGVEGLRDALDGARHCPNRATSLDAQRQLLNEVIPELIAAREDAVIDSSTGSGKTYAALLAVISALARGQIKRAVLAVPTRALANERASEAISLANEVAPGAVKVGTRLGRSESECKLENQTPGIVAAAAASRAGGAAALCRACTLSDKCQWYRQSRRALPYGLTITTHAAIAPQRASDGTWAPPTWASGVEVIVYDEDVLGTLKQPLTLPDWQLRQVLDDEAMARLIACDKASSAQLTDIMSEAVITEHNRDPRQVDEDIEDLAGLNTSTLNKLAGRVPWFTSCTLASARERGWRGCSWYKGYLTIPAAPMDVALARGTHSTLYLDATTTEALASITLPGARWIDIGGPVPASTRVITLDRQISSSSQKHQEGAALACAVRARVDAPTTLHVTHKRWASLVSSQVEGPVIHFGGAAARGSNTYRSGDTACDTITLPAWYVPTTAKIAEAEWLEDRAAALDVSTTLDARIEARHRLETSEILQTIGRIGPNGEDQKCVILMGPAPPTLPVDEVWHASDLIEVRGATGVAAALRRMVMGAGGVWAPRAHRARIDGAWTRLGGSLSNKTGQTDTQPCPSTPYNLDAGVHNHFGGSWTRAAQAAGLDTALIDNDRGAALLVIVQPGAHLSPGTLKPALASLDLQWFKWQGRRHNQIDKLSDVRSMIPDGVPVTIDELSAAAGVSGRTIRRWIKLAGWLPSAYLDAQNTVSDVQELTDEAPCAEIISIADVIEARSEVEPDPTPPPTYGSHYFRRRSEMVTLGQLMDGSAALAIPQQIEFERAAVALQNTFAEMVTALARPHLELVSMASTVATTFLDNLARWPVERGAPAPGLDRSEVEALAPGVDVELVALPIPRPHPEDYGIWPLITSSVDGDEDALDEVLRLYLPACLASDIPRWVDMLMELDDEHRAMYVENLWLAGAVDELHLSSLHVS